MFIYFYSADMLTAAKTNKNMNKLIYLVALRNIKKINILIHLAAYSKCIIGVSAVFIKMKSGFK